MLPRPRLLDRGGVSSVANWFGCEARTGALAQHLKRLTSTASGGNNRGAPDTSLPSAFGRDCDNGHGPTAIRAGLRIAAEPTAPGLAARPRPQIATPKLYHLEVNTSTRSRDAFAPMASAHRICQSAANFCGAILAPVHLRPERHVEYSARHPDIVGHSCDRFVYSHRYCAASRSLQSQRKRTNQRSLGLAGCRDGNHRRHRDTVSLQSPLRRKSVGRIVIRRLGRQDGGLCLRLQSALRAAEPDSADGPHAFVPCRDLAGTDIVTRLVT